MSYSPPNFCLLVICSPNENVISLFVSVCVCGRKVFDLYVAQLANLSDLLNNQQREYVYLIAGGFALYILLID